jgi:hypothetical protein
MDPSRNCGKRLLPLSRRAEYLSHSPLHFYMAWSVRSLSFIDALRLDVEPYFLQGSLIFKDRPPVIREMLSRGFNISLLPDKHHWQRLAKPKSIRHLCEMLKAALLLNIAILKGARNKDVLYVPSSPGCK